MSRLFLRGCWWINFAYTEKKTLPYSGVYFPDSGVFSFPCRLVLKWRKIYQEMFMLVLYQFNSKLLVFITRLSYWYEIFITSRFSESVKLILLTTWLQWYFCWNFLLVRGRNFLKKLPIQVLEKKFFSRIFLSPNLCKPSWSYRKKGF